MPYILLCFIKVNAVNKNEKNTEMFALCQETFIEMAPFMCIT